MKLRFTKVTLTAVLFFCCGIQAQGISNLGENVDLFDTTGAYLQHFRADTLYLGAAFFRDASKDFKVFFESSGAYWIGYLYLMYPDGTRDTLLSNHPGDCGTLGRTSIDLTARTAGKIHDGDTVVFGYQVVVNGDCTPVGNLPLHYSGPNRSPLDNPPWKVTDRFWSADYSAAPPDYGFNNYPIGRRWCVAGVVHHLPDGTPAQNQDTAEFSFEDGGDHKFNDCRFLVTGLYLIRKPTPIDTTIELTANPNVDTIIAGDSITYTAKVYSTVSGKVELPNLSNQVTWMVMGYGNPALKNAGPGTTNVFYGVHAYQLYAIEADYKDPVTGSIYRARKTVYVKPGPPDHLVIESLWGDFTVKDKNKDVPLTTPVQINPSSSNVAVYAVVRDKFQNYISLASNAAWNSLNSALVTVVASSGKNWTGLLNPGPMGNCMADTIQIVALSAGLRSDSTDVSVTCLLPLPIPKATPSNGNMWPGKAITLTDDTTGATIYYSVNGGTFTAYTTAVTITGSTTLKAYATKAGHLQSDTLTVSYAWVPAKLPIPKAGPTAGTNGWPSLSVTLTDDSSGTAIFYSVNGGAFTAYASPFALSAASIVKAYATKTGYTSSDTLTVSYPWIPNKLPIPKATPASGTNVWPSTPMTLSDDSAGTTIYYSLNNGAFAAYASPVSLVAASSVRAYASKNGFTSSDTLSVSYSWVPSQVSAPLLSINPGTYTYLIDTLHLTDTTPGAVIYYAFDNSSFSTTNWTLYAPGTPIAIHGTETLRAIATKPDWTNSNELTAQYIIALPKTATPYAVPGSGVYDIPLDSIQLFCNTPGATIYYTFGSSVFSTTGWTRYTTGTYLSIDHSSTLRAVAIADPNYVQSDEYRAIYRIEFKITVSLSANPFRPDATSLPPEAVAAATGRNIAPFGITATLTSALPIADAGYLIYDALGNVLTDKVPAILDQNSKKGYLIWDGHNQNHRVVGSGSYLMVITASDREGNSTVVKQMIGVKR